MRIFSMYLIQINFYSHCQYNILINMFNTQKQLKHYNIYSIELKNGICHCV